MISNVWKAGSFKTKIPSARPVPIIWCRRLAAGARLGPATPRPRPSKQGNLCPLSPTGRGEGGCGQRRQGCSAHLSGGCWTVCVLELSTNLCEISQILIATCDSLKTSVPILSTVQTPVYSVRSCTTLLNMLTCLPAKILVKTRIRPKTVHCKNTNTQKV